jgi:hypothetical protein
MTAHLNVRLVWTTEYIVREAAGLSDASLRQSLRNHYCILLDVGYGLQVKCRILYPNVEFLSASHSQFCK